MRRLRAPAWFVLIVSAGCAQPIDGLWPPRPGDATHRVVVSTDAWHSVIGLRGDDGDVEEWGYAERAYYLEGHDGVCGTLHALFVPSAAVVTTTRGTRTWAERTPQPPGSSWEFELTDAGYARLVAFLHDDVADERPISHAGGADWFDAKSSYDALHHCHHWTAAGLREAGLPVWTVYAMFKWSLEAQLDRAARTASESGAASPAASSTFSLPIDDDAP